MSIMLIDQSYGLETRVALVDGPYLEDFDYEFAHHRLTKGNIYLARAMRIEPSLQAVFLDYGDEKHGFLPFSEIHPSFYQSPKNMMLPKAISEDQPIEDRDLLDGDEASIIRKPLPGARIQDVIKRNQILLVQVVKDIRGTKGAALTTYISLPGKYCVLMPNTPKGSGISRKINDPKDREELRQIVDSLKIPEGMSLIVRTAGLGRKKNEIKKDADYLMRLWSDIEKKIEGLEAPSIVYEESDLVTRALRDLYSSDVEKVLIQGDEAYKKARSFMRMFMPTHVKKMHKYQEPQDSLFQSFGIEDQIASIHESTLTLASGGSIVINPTEALVSIDVNSARSTKERNIEETALKTNLEAAVAIGRQLRLRDLSGLIVIDFIDMPSSRNGQVEKLLKEQLKQDRARIQMGKISAFGLLEMSRQRLRQSLLESSSSQCPYCSGKGRVLSLYVTSLNCLHLLEKEARQTQGQIIAYACGPIVSYLLNEKRSILLDLETRYQVSIYLKEDAQLHIEDFRMSFVPFSSEKETIPINKRLLKSPDNVIEPPALKDAESNAPEPTNAGKPSKKRRKKSKNHAGGMPSGEDFGSDSAEKKPPNDDDANPLEKPTESMGEGDSLSNSIAVGKLVRKRRRKLKGSGTHSTNGDTIAEVRGYSLKDESVGNDVFQKTDEPSEKNQASTIKNRKKRVRRRKPTELSEKNALNPEGDNEDSGIVNGAIEFSDKKIENGEWIAPKASRRRRWWKKQSSAA